jgi:hypothetical protein
MAAVTEARKLFCVRAAYPNNQNKIGFYYFWTLAKFSFSKKANIETFSVQNFKSP